MSFVQTGRRLAITTPLGDNALLLRALTGVEAVSQLFSFEAELLSENDSINFQSIVGQKVTIALLRDDGKERYWNGYVRRFSQGVRDGNFTHYHASIVPWLWFLTRTADCRIFQKKKAPDIIKQIFSDLGFSDFSLRLYGSFTEREYCVQYRETDFNFVSRLMEEEGISYFFEHEQSKHTLVLANDASAYKPCPGKSSVPYLALKGGARSSDAISDLRQEQEFRPESYSLTDFNFETPSVSLAVSVPGRKQYDVYDYPGEYTQRKDGDSLARLRLQEQAARGVLVRGTSDCRQFTSGYTFTLKDHYRSDLNTTYLITAVRHTASQGGYESGGAGDELTYQNSFEGIPNSTVFRPARVTPQPFVQGCQTAIVVGPGGEEIYTDQHGRVKVQFHWDREGKRNENSSCWIRVSQPWAGKGWGSVAIPRIGQEVVIDFLEGNPDAPIIVGRVYNAEQQPPFGMPGGAMISGMKSSSTKGGGGYNEISLNDTKGTELIQIHGQYDMDTSVVHDQRLSVGNNQSETISVNKSSTVGSNKSISVGANHDEVIGGSKTLNVTGTHTEVIGSTMSLTVNSSEMETVAIAKALTIGAAYQVSVGAVMNETVGGAKLEEIGGAKVVGVAGLSSEAVGGSKSVKAGGSISHGAAASISMKAGSNVSATAGGKISQKAGSDFAAAAGGKMALSSDGNFNVGGKAKGVIDIADQLVLKCGSASITLKSGGDVIIKGSSISVKADSSITMSGSEIKEN